MIKFSQDPILNTVNSTSGYIYVSRIPALIGDTYKCAHTAFLTILNTKRIHIKLSHTFCD